MRHINAPYRRISEDASLTKRLCFKTVAIVQRDESISLDCLDAGINPELAHVVVGAPGSPYGEVVVILPHIAVIGIRCTFHGYDIAVNELSEKTLRDGLKTFAQVPGGEKYYCIWATNGVLGFPQGTFGEMRN
ncbi:Hypothetical protein, putative [Bodo saltans]|uniref:Uncharacterized protein n=1 Tax=Bodo saltans TaxID=75058 RepID=A0A0S4JIW5_BODSA|nr:Hypothetical protein, putative [Bodo saltans]|eukprot:CUG90110.1 Hypothetical protein, putative [Bodo saltans]